jgi:hypothetical protein
MITRVLTMLCWLVLATGGAAWDHGSPTAPVVAYYVAASGGSDSNAGTKAAPFATIAYALTQMEGGLIKTTYLEPGTYTLTGPIEMTSADNGETLAGDPANPRTSVILDATTTYDEAIWILGGSYITIQHLTTYNTIITGICIHGGVNASNQVGTPACVNTTVEAATSNTVTDVEIFNITKPNQDVGNSGAVLVQGNAANTTISYSYFHSLTGMGIRAGAFTNAGDTISNLNITGNAIFLSMQNNEDGACVFLSDVRATSTNLNVTKNMCRDYEGSSSGTGSGSGPTWCGYFDGGTSNVNFIGNVCGNPGNSATPPAAFQGMVYINCGENVVIEGNIFDLGYNGDVITMGMGSSCGAPGTTTAMTGNKFKYNIVIMNFTGFLHTANFGGSGCAGKAFISGSPPPHYPDISDNIYWNYAAGGAAQYPGCWIRESAATVADPLVSGLGTGGYTINPTSPAFNSPVNFPGITAGWGNLISIAQSASAPPSN